jgi:hypothetical protein
MAVSAHMHRTTIKFVMGLWNVAASEAAVGNVGAVSDPENAPLASLFLSLVAFNHGGGEP